VDNCKDLLIEIGTEELPPTALLRLSAAFRDGLARQLRDAGLDFSGIAPFASPRRLALLVRGLMVRQPDQEVVRRGPALASAFGADGNPSQAALGFARSCGVEVSDLERQTTDQGAWLVFRRAQPGRAATELLPGMVEHALGGLPIPKRMRWGSGEEQFVRPVHWVCLVFGAEVVPGKVLGLTIGRETRGHRFHAPGALTIPRADAYADLLRTQGRVEPDFTARRELIRGQVEALAETVACRARVEDDLLDEVTALCEWPRAILGSFSRDFLEVPPEALIETMQSNQKYFPLFDGEGRLYPGFITVANIESRDPDQVRQGNERVIRPRFSDAAFFWKQDLRHPLDAQLPRLETVVFQDRLGTLGEKSRRVAQGACAIARDLGQDIALAERSALLAKCDLMTHMIFEFPALQGTMGRYYAERSGEDPCVAAAMEEQYLPRFAGDRLPQSDCGRALALADRLDTLVGIFAIGQRPTGVKDPYALRRTALGILRILIETPLALDLKPLLANAAEQLAGKVDAAKAADEVLEYSLERLKGYYQEQSIPGDSVDAVLATGVTSPADLDRRIHAVQAFRRLPEAAALAAANKRIRNILKKSGFDPVGQAVNPALLAEPAEQSLSARITEAAKAVAPLQAAQDYTGVLMALAQLRPEVDAFFDAVMVMAEDEALRRNRLVLLGSLEALFLSVADISVLQ
jgi:glycyl-tRNA synthetase beta chain